MERLFIKKTHIPKPTIYVTFKQKKNTPEVKKYKKNVLMILNAN